ILEPLVITSDNYVVSGHRRRAAAILAGLRTVPCRRLPFRRADLDSNQYVKLIRGFNRQRSKTIDEILKENMGDADPEVAYFSLIKSRLTKAFNSDGEFTISGIKHRFRISNAKKPMLDAVIKLIMDRKDYWPLQDRGVHYALLNDPPLRHAK